MSDQSPPNEHDQFVWMTERAAELEARLAEAEQDVKDLAAQLGEQDVLLSVAEAADRYRDALEPFLRRPRYLSIGSEGNTVEIRVSRKVFDAAVAALDPEQK